MSTILRKAVTRIILDVSSPDVQKAVSVTQGDVNRKFEITLVDGGRPFPLHPKWTAALVGIKPDGKNLFNSCVVDETGKIVYDFAGGEEIATAAGGYAIYFEIYDEVGDTLASPSIWLTVIPFPSRDMASEDQYTAARELVRRLNEMEGHLEIFEEYVGNIDWDVLGNKEHIKNTIALAGGALTKLSPDLCPESRTMEVRDDVDNVHLVKIDATKYTIKAQQLQGRWVLIGDLRGYIASNNSDTLTLFTDETKTTPLVMTVSAGTTIYPADEDVTELVRELVLVRKGADLCPESRTMEVRNDVDNVHLVKIDATKYTLRANQLQGRWVLIGDLRGYIGSNTSDTLTVYTDETRSTPLCMTVSAGTIISPVDEDLIGDLEDVRKLISNKAINVDLSAMETTGEIVEIYADDTTKTTTMEFDEDGNPIRITDSDGHVTTLKW